MVATGRPARPTLVWAYHVEVDAAVGAMSMATAKAHWGKPSECGHSCAILRTHSVGRSGSRLEELMLQKDVGVVGREED